MVNHDIGRFTLRKTLDDACPFLLRGYSGWSCGLQATKPLACKIWPFRILSEPEYGYQDESCFEYRNKRFYVYAMPFCPGISWGRPEESFIKKTLPEFIDVRIGLQARQHFTTSRFKNI